MQTASACSSSRSSSSSPSSWVSAVRAEFPALVSASDWIFCDAPGGTQVHSSVGAAVSARLLTPTANLHGTYPSALTTIRGVARARETVAAFFNCAPSEVVFGANMTTLTMHVARGVARSLFRPGDNVVVTELDHDGNVTPWVDVAEDMGVEVRRVGFDVAECVLDLRQLESSVDSRTRVVAVGAASNACGSLTPIKRVAEVARAKSASGVGGGGGAVVFVDAVHFAPHRLVDVEEMDCDFLVCSAYKFCGPHAGLLFGKEKWLNELRPYKLVASPDSLPDGASRQTSRWETGTANFAVVEGVRASIDYLASLGVRSGSVDVDAPLRRKLKGAFEAIEAHEKRICQMFLRGVEEMERLKVFGVIENLEDQRAEDSIGVATSRLRRTPTFCLRMTGLSAPELAQALVDRGVICGAGNFYAVNFPRFVGVDGFTRIGFFHYNTLEEVDRVVKALRDIADSP